MPRTVHGDRDRGGRGVSHLLDVHEHLFGGKPQALAQGGEDPGVRLMADHDAQVRRCDAGLVQQRPGSVRHGGDGRLEHRLPVQHPEEVPPSLDGLDGRRLRAAARRDGEQFSLTSVKGQEGIDHAGLLGRLQQGGPRPVAEEHARRPVGEVQHAGEHLRPNDEHPVGGPRLHLGRPNREGVGESSAGGVQVERRPGHPEPRLDERRRGQDEPFGRARRHDEEIDARGADPGPAEGFGARVGRQGGGGLALAGEPALPDPRPVRDPLVRGVDQRLEVRVRYDPGGQGRRDRAHPGIPFRRHRRFPGGSADFARRGASSSQTRGCPWATGSPSRTRIPATRASMGD